MNQVVNKNTFFIKEHVGFFKAANNFDIYDPETGDVIMECREPNLGFFTKLLRFTDYKRMTPFDVQIRTPEGDRIVRIKRGISLFVSEVLVTDQDDQEIGRFSQHFFSIGGKFDVQDANQQTVCQLVGKWTSWDFYFKNDEHTLAHVSKEWAGLGKELLTSADNYVLNISESMPENDNIRKLILAAVMCIDMVLKE